MTCTALKTFWGRTCTKIRTHYLLITAEPAPSHIQLQMFGSTQESYRSVLERSNINLTFSSGVPTWIPCPKLRMCRLLPAFATQSRTAASTAAWEANKITGSILPCVTQRWIQCQNYIYQHNLKRKSNMSSTIQALSDELPFSFKTFLPIWCWRPVQCRPLFMCSQIWNMSITWPPGQNAGARTLIHWRQYHYYWQAVTPNTA